MKVCSRCRELLQLADFSLGTSKDGRNNYCKDCVKEYDDERRKAKVYQIRRREIDYQRKYGLTLKQREELIAAQGSKCKNVNCDVTIDLVTDHCHVSGEVRGFLCSNCNLALGNAQDSVAILEGLIEYLKEFS